MSEFEPRIVVFACNWCSYAGADTAGASRLAHSPQFRVIRTMCSGRVSAAHVLRAFQLGADGVLVVSPHEGGVRMEYWNADGSPAEMCGNGARCVAAILAGEDGHAQSFTLSSPAGPIAASVGDDGRVVEWEGVRPPLIDPVPAGERRTVDALLVAPRRSGSYRLQWDVVQEGKICM